jgi:hypothetical protein
MDTQRALLRGAGFWPLPSGPDLSTSLARLRLDTPVSSPLPIVDLLGEDPYVDALIETMVLEVDRPRFRAYMKEAPLGLRIMTAVCSYSRRTGAGD